MLIFSNVAAQTEPFMMKIKYHIVTFTPIKICLFQLAKNHLTKKLTLIAHNIASYKLCDLFTS